MPAVPPCAGSLPAALRVASIADPEDTTFAATNEDYRFLRIDNDGIAVTETVQRIQAWAPELYKSQ